MGLASPLSSWTRGDKYIVKYLIVNNSKASIDRIQLSLECSVQFSSGEHHQHIHQVIFNRSYNTNPNNNHNNNNNNSSSSSSNNNSNIQGQIEADIDPSNLEPQAHPNVIGEEEILEFKRLLESNQSAEAEIVLPDHIYLSYTGTIMSCKYVVVMKVVYGSGSGSAVEMAMPITVI